MPSEPAPSEASVAPAALPAAPQESGPEAAPTEPAEPSAKPKVSEVKAPAASAKLVPAPRVAALKAGPGGLYILPQQGKLAWLSTGMVLPVVAAPGKDKKARLLGEAKLVKALPRRSLVQLDDRVREAGQDERLFVVLPEHSSAKSEPGASTASSEPRAATPPPEPTPLESTPSEPPAPSEPAPASKRELNGRTRLDGIGPFRRLILTQTDTILWSDCILVKEGRDMYKLGGMAPGGTREIPLSDFKPGPREVPFVGKDRIGLFCAEGERLFPNR